MPRRPRQIIQGNIYHVLNRGVDKRKIFLNDKDYLRFVHNLFEFNDVEPICNHGYFLSKRQVSTIGVGNRYERKKPRKLLVEILIFTLMPNHYHLMIKPLRENGLSEFMRKINGGYANYFNIKHERNGALFESKYKLVPIETQAHFIHLPYYIHSNPLDLVMPEWRERKIKDYKKAMEFLENYRWSSFPDYIGKKNFPSVTSREFLMEIYKTPGNYKKEFKGWLKELNFNILKGTTLED